MRIFPLFTTLAAGLVLPLSVSAAPAAPPFAHEKSDIPAHPDVLWGKLENGLRYAVMRHTEPPGRLSLRMHVHAGSLNEREEQRGLAHFLEHMAFNGSENFKPDELVAILQNLGIAFGADLNAFTSFDQTVYMLDLPKNDNETIDKCFKVMRDWAAGMTLPAEEIEKERGVILAEKKSRDSVEMRLMEKQFDAILPQSLITKRFPIGTEEVISGAQRDLFVDFYTHYYTPDRQTIVVVGDFDAAAMVERVKSVFGSIKPLEKRSPDPELGKVTPTGLTFRVFQDNEVKSTDVDITCLKSYQAVPDTSAQRARRLTLQLANAMLNRRFEELAKKEGSPIVTATASSNDFLDFVRFSGVSVTAAKDRWQEALAVGEHELRRALDHGFNPSELTQATANLTRAYEDAVKTQATQKADSIAMDIIGSVNDNSVFSSPESDLAVFKAALPGITPELCAAALRDVWSGDDRFVSITTKNEIKDGEKLLESAWRESIAVKVDAIEVKGEAKFAYETIGEPGTVVTKKTIEDLGITQLVLSNNTRVNLKRTDFKKNEISMLGRFGAGKLTMDKAKPGLDMFSGVVVNGGGLEAHSVDDLERVFAGKKVGVAFSVEDDAFALSGSTRPEDLELQLKLFCASLLHPGYRPEAERQFRNMLPILGMQMSTTDQGVFGTRGQRLLMGGDTRFGLEGVEELSKHKTDDVKSWLAEAFAKGALEVSIVGDFDPAAVEPVILSTIGALPVRESAVPALDDAKVVPALAAGAHRLEYQSKIPKALNMVIWPTADRSDIKLSRRLNLLGDVLGDRLRVKIREEMGDAYSPHAGAQASDTWKDFGNIMAISPGDPAKSAEVIAKIIAIADDLANNGATEEETGRALKPLLTGIEQQRRSNGYWLETVLGRSQSKPEVLDWAREMQADYASIKAAELTAIAAKYLHADRARTILVTTPAEAAKPAEDAKKQAAEPAKKEAA
ncbi:MAG: M16 family metallopeptidase [Verrucomicrobiales bacterium]